MLGRNKYEDLDDVHELYLRSLTKCISNLDASMGKGARDKFVTEWNKAVEEEISQLVLDSLDSKDKSITETLGAKLGALHNDTINPWGRSYEFGVTDGASSMSLSDLINAKLAPHIERES